MKFNRTREVDGSAGQILDSGSLCQVVALDTLSKDLVNQIFLFWRLSGIAAPVICGQHSYVKGREQGP